MSNIVTDAIEILGDMFERALKNLWGEIGEEEKPKRARTKGGKYKADDKTTKDINEAWVGGKSPKKKKK